MGTEGEASMGGTQGQGAPISALPPADAPSMHPLWKSSTRGRGRAGLLGTLVWQSPEPLSLHPGWNHRSRGYAGRQAKLSRHLGPSLYPLGLSFSRRGHFCWSSGPLAQEKACMPAGSGASMGLPESGQHSVLRCE